MIFITIGHHPDGFDRLVYKLEEIAKDINEEMIIQTGHTKYQLHNMRCFSFKPYEEIIQFMREARVIVCHGGSCVMDGLMLGKPMIVVPRFAKYNEARDDHQKELAERLRIENKIEVAYDVDDLKRLLMQSYQVRESVTKENKLINYLRESANILLKGK